VGAEAVKDIALLACLNSIGGKGESRMQRIKIRFTKCCFRGGVQGPVSYETVI